MQTCTFCKNHGQIELKKGHKSKCPYASESHWEECRKCEKTRDRQNSVACEKKLDYKMRAQTTTLPYLPDGRERAMRVCRKCKRHGQIVVLNKEHNQGCPYMDCVCIPCKTTDTRRKHVRNDLMQTRFQKRLQSYDPHSSNVSTDSGHFSPGSTTSFPEYFMEYELDQAVVLESSGDIAMVPLGDAFGDTAQIQRDADMLIDQLENESQYQVDLDLSLSDQEWKDLSELYMVPQNL